MHKRLLLLLFLGCLCTYAQAQQALPVLKGRVVDASTKQPVEGASIQVENSGRFAFSDTEGAFEIAADTTFPGEYLVVFHINYQPYRHRVSGRQQPLLLELTPKVNVLPEITIAARKNTGPEKVTPSAVLDYAVLPNHLLLLQRITGQPNPVLQLVNSRDSLLLAFDLTMPAKEIMKDCFGNFHLATADSVFQLFLEKEHIILYPSHTMAEYRKLLEPCVTSTAEKFYYRQELSGGLVVNYFSMTRTRNATPRLLRNLQDKEALTMQKNENRFQLMKAEAGMGRTSHDRENSTQFMKQVLTRPPYVPLLKIGEEFCLFNHLQHRLEFYRHDSLTRLLPVSYHRHKDWHEQIVLDEEAQQPYVVYEKNGFLELHALSLQTGRLGHSYRLPVTYAKRVEVHSGRVYFLYREPERGFRQHLYRKEL